jgi:hypothetical protein
MFGLVIGLVIGVLASVLVIPQRQSTVQALGAAAPGGVGGAGGTTTGQSDAAAPAPGGGPAAATVGTGGGAVGSGGGGAGSAQAGGAAGGGGPGSGAGGAASGSAGGGSAPVASGSARGVTSTAIRIGVAYPDLSALKALGPEYDNGDVKAQWEALLAGMKKSKQLPVAGRTIEFVYRSYNVLDANDQNAACRGLVSDDKVFMVIGVAYFASGSDCVARQFHTPLLTSDGPTDPELAAGAPYLFSLGWSDSRNLRNMVQWAARRGALKGHKIGIYHLSDAASTREVDQNLIAPLRSLGFSVAARDATDQSLGGPEDAVAVQKFRAAGVDLAILLTSKTGFLQQAQSQGYKPHYLDSDHDFGTSDTAASNYPADQWDGTYAITDRIVGNAPAGMPAPAGAEECVRNYEKQSGDKVARPANSGHDTAEYAYVLTSCDLGKVLLAAVRAAGRDLTAGTFIRGMHTLHGMSLTRFAPVDFTRRNDGAGMQRTVQWRRTCTCWVAVSGFSGTFVP